MAGANKAMNPQELQGVLKGFEEQSMRMEMAEEMRAWEWSQVRKGLYG